MIRQLPSLWRLISEKDAPPLAERISEPPRSENTNTVESLIQRTCEKSAVIGELSAYGPPDPGQESDGKL